MSRFEKASILQDITTSTNNSTEVNLAAAATFTGTADETLGINGIQVFHASNENCTIYLDQCIDTDFNANDTITDSFVCLADTPCSRTYTSVSPYYRMRVTNNGASTTTKLATFTGMTPIINPLPRALTDDGRLMTETTITGRHNTDRHAWINPTSEQATSPVYRMVGTAFEGVADAGDVDTNFWTAVIDAGTDGSVVQGGGEIEMKTSATATGWAKLTSARKSRFVAGSAQLFQGGFNFKTAATADNIRRVGVYTTTAAVNTPVDGFYFELDNATFSVNSRADGGTVSSVASGSFNGEYGVSWTPTADTYYNLSIEWTPLGVFFYVNNNLLHKKLGAHQSYYMTLPITIENIYTSGAVDVEFETVGMYIARQGELITNPTSYYHELGTEAGLTLKYGAGTLRGIVVSNCVKGAVITLSDSTTAITPTIWTFTSGKLFELPTTIDFFGLPFSDGLRLYITAQNACVTVIYE